MKKIFALFIACVALVSAAVADTFPVVNIAETAEGIPAALVADIVSSHPDASAINIVSWHQAEASSTSAAGNPVGVLVFPTQYTYSNIKVNYAQRHGKFRSDFLLSVARGATAQLTATYSFSTSAIVSGSVTAGDNKNVALPLAATLGLNINSSVAVTIAVSRVFSGPSESSQYNTRLFYVDYYGDIGGWSCTATRALPASTVQMSGMFIEPTDYVEYSVDKLIQ